MVGTQSEFDRRCIQTTRRTAMFNRNQFLDGLKEFLMDSAVTGYRTYRRENRYATLKIAGVAVGGIAIGVAVGMLIAPKSGDKLRADISKKASELADKAT